MATSLDGKLDEILAQLSSQKEDISNLKSELKQNTKAVSSQVKKIKSESDFSWKRQGNKIQFTFNSDLEDFLKQGIWAIENEKTDYAVELLSETLEKIKQRNKLIKVADSSEGDWETVKQYITNSLASDSEGEKKFQKQILGLRKSARVRLRLVEIRKLRQMLLLQRLLQILFCLAVFFQHGRKEPIVSNPSTAHSRVFSSKGKGVPFEPTEDADSPAVHSLTGARIVLSVSSSQPQIPPRSSSRVGEERVDFLKDENFLTDNFYEYEQGQIEILVRNRLRKNVGFWRNKEASQFVLDTVTNG